MGAHLSRNCIVSKLTRRVMASGFSATASTTVFKALFTRACVSDSGSFSQSTRSDGASGVEMVRGSLRKCLSASLTSKSIRSSMMARYWQKRRVCRGEDGGIIHRQIASSLCLLTTRQKRQLPPQHIQMSRVGTLEFFTTKYIPTLWTVSLPPSNYTSSTNSISKNNYNHKNSKRT